MRTPGRLSAAIEILEDFEARRVPLKTALADWGRNNRYAGAKDRAWISGLCLDVLRSKASLGAAMGEGAARALVLGAMRFLWRIELLELTEVAGDEEHGPGALSEAEIELLSNHHLFIPAPVGECQQNEKAGIQTDTPLDFRFRGNERNLEIAPHITGNFPEWMAPHIERVFGEDAPSIMANFAVRADVDLRLNTLKAETEKSLKALKSVNGESLTHLQTAARIPAPKASERSASVTIIPAFNKGWVEVQDLGSQIATAAAGEIKGAQVLDFCAGGGGKSLALAALMENTGQLYAYDKDARRLKPLFHRAKRAGLRNLQIRSPAGGEGLGDLAGKMDVVFVDAPCSGAGTWRRHPDAKWRLTPQQLERRMAEQDTVLRQASAYVRPGGRMIWVTCSFLMEENEDRLGVFLKEHPQFTQSPALDGIIASNLLTDEGREALGYCVTPDGAIRLTPDKLRADGFFIAVLARG